MRFEHAPILVCAAAALAAVTLAPPPMAAATFQGLGHLPGYDISVARGVNSDGSVVVGYGRSSNFSEVEAFRWTRAEGIQGLGFLPGFSNSYASGVSGDGSTIVGGSDSRAFRWTSAEGMQSLGFQTVLFLDEAFVADSNIAISADGSTIVSARGSNAFRWTSAGGLQTLRFPQGVTFASANGINADGSVFVGGYNGPGNLAFRWTNDGGFQYLSLPPPAEFNPSAHAVSADGSVVVGFNGTYAFRWTAEGTQLLGDPRYYSDARGVSGDGSIVVGNSEVAPFIWDATHGVRNIQQVLVGDYGLDLTGWTIQNVTAISADGRTIVGNGIHRRQSEAWIATLTQTGDYNDDGTVDQADLDLVLLNWGEMLDVPAELGWVNDLPVGSIDQAELDGVLLNWGSTVALGSTAGVPEPSTLVLLLTVAGLGMGFYRMR
jgi:probable HAF family extracellular repeat protein